MQIGLLLSLSVRVSNLAMIDHISAAILHLAGIVSLGVMIVEGEKNLGTLPKKGKSMSSCLRVLLVIQDYFCVSPVMFSFCE